LLNAPEATAIVADTIAEAARSGARVNEARAAGSSVLGRDDLLPGVAEIIGEIRVEALFDDGTRLVVLPDPFGPALDDSVTPGAVLVAEPGHEPAPRPTVQVLVTNRSQVPISISSHFHFFEANPALEFDRRAAFGRHLDVPAGSVQRFEPAAPTTVGLVPIGGRRIVVGFSGLVEGPLDAPGSLEAAVDRARSCGYLDAIES
jgi:urease subunit gamma/beta